MKEATKSMYRNNRNIMRTNHEQLERLETKISVKEGCAMSPVLFQSIIDEAIKVAKQKKKNKFRILEDGKNGIDRVQHSSGRDGGEYTIQFENIQYRI